MNTEKLLKAIQILIKEEIKQQLPELIKEGVKTEVKRILAEHSKPQQPKKENIGLSMAKAILGEDTSKKTSQKIATEMVEEVQYVKDAVLNQILNETRQSSMDKTVNFNNPNIAGAGIAGLRAEMAAKMGYSDMGGGGAQPGGLGVQTGNEALDKALNRNYSELVKRF
jgi:hypothetical protein